MTARRVLPVLAVVLLVVGAVTPFAQANAPRASMRPATPTSARRPGVPAITRAGHAPTPGRAAPNVLPRVPKLDPRVTRLQPSGPVHVTVAGPAASATAAVRAAGGQVLASISGELSAVVPAEKLAQVAGAAGVTAVRPAVRAIMDATSEGVHASLADAWQSAGRTGAGATVAVVDGGFANLAAEVTGGNLPAGQTVAGDHCANVNGSQHGTAVAEIVHQMAPGATLLLYCVDDAIGFHSAETELKAAGAKIVNSSLSFPLDSRGDGTGAETSTAATVKNARSAGILWIESAGNTGGDHWGGSFVRINSGSLTGFANLTYPSPAEAFDAVDVYQGGSALLALKWDQWPNSSIPVQLVAYGYQCTGACTGSNETPINPDSHGNPTPIVVPQDANTPPQLWIDVNNTSLQGDQEWDVAMQLPPGALAAHYDLSYYGDVTLSYLSGPTKYQARAAAGSIDDPASSPYALAVGAIGIGQSAVEVYSSQGPTIDGRIKPDLTAFDGVSSNLADFASGFYGTSAAAPHVAGAAALVASVNPGFDAAQIEFWLRRHANPAAAGDVPTPDRGYGVLSLGSPGPVTAPATSGYEALTSPIRAYDSRNDPAGKLRAGHAQRTVSLPSEPTGATAVAINLGGTQAEGTTYLTVGATTVGNTSNLNLTKTDSTAAVYAVVPVSASGTIVVANPGVPANAFVDVLGYFVAGTGEGYTAVTPTRIFDTRTVPPNPTRIGQNASVTVTAPASLPAGTRSLVVTVTAANATGVGFLAVSPDGATTSSTLNYFARRTRANTTVVGLTDATNGKTFTVFNGGPPTDVIVDLLGYFSDSGTGKFVPLTPVRIADTRTGNGGRHTPLQSGGQGQDATVALTGSGIFGVPYAATAVVAGVVPVPPPTSPESYLTVWGGGTRPNTSNVNFSGGRLVPNAVFANLDPAALTRTFSIYNANATADVVVDLFGYFIG